MNLGNAGHAIGRIMIVDEDAFQGQVLNNVIQAMKLGPTRVYTDFETARRNLEQHRIDCLMMDWFMARDYGLSLAKLVRSGTTAQPADLPIVLCTGRTLRRDIFIARDTGISEIVAKPLVPEQVYLKVMAACKQPRKFIQSASYVGPDRRRRNLPFEGPERRGRAGLRQDAIDAVMHAKRTAK